MTNINTTITLYPPNQEELIIIITTNEILMLLSCNFITSYINYNENCDIFFLVLGFVSFIYLLFF